MASYHEQVVVCTGRSDWPSKIEDDDGLPLVQGLKKALGGKGRFFNPFHNVLVTASSLSTPANTSSSATTLLFPSFRTITLPDPDHTTIETLIKGYILAPTLEWRLPTPPPNPGSLVRDPELSSSLPSTPLSDLTVLICGHGNRDSRCGIMSPVLEAEFADKLSAAGYSVGGDMGSEGDGRRALIGAISHVGGHKYAGNVIVYVPPSWQHPLAGCGVWYGRVEPKHVEGIVKETICEGKVIKELFRGGIDLERRPIFLDG